MGQDLAKAAQVKILNIMAGADRDDLREYIKPKLARFLIDNTKAQTSTMRDVEQIEQEMKDCKNAADMAKLEVKKLHEAAAKAKKDKEDFEAAKKEADDDFQRLQDEKQRLL